MKANFDPSLQRVLTHEGGFANHPKDPGGATMRGVTQRVYDGFRKARGLPIQSVRYISLDEIRVIYRKLYADKVLFDELPRGVDYVCFDGAVNSGPTQAVKWIQRAAGCVNCDGNMGPATLQTIYNYPDHDKLIAKCLSLRLGMLQNLKTWSTFGAGWRTRVADCLRAGQAWATGSVGPQPIDMAAPEKGSAAKARKEDADLPQHEEAAAAASAGGTVGGGVIETTRQQLEPLSWSGWEWVNYILLGLALASAAIAIGTLAYSWWASRKRKRVDAAMNAENYEDVFALEEVQSA